MVGNFELMIQAVAYSQGCSRCFLNHKSTILERIEGAVHRDVIAHSMGHCRAVQQAAQPEERL